MERREKTEEYFNNIFSKSQQYLQRKRYIKVKKTRQALRQTHLCNVKTDAIEEYSCILT